MREVSVDVQGRSFGRTNMQLFEAFVQRDSWHDKQNKVIN